jgi:hypothetical protein
MILDEAIVETSVLEVAVRDEFDTEYRTSDRASDHQNSSDRED